MTASVRAALRRLLPQETISEQPLSEQLPEVRSAHSLVPESAPHVPDGIGATRDPSGGVLPLEWARDDVFVGGTYRFLPSRQLGVGPFVSFDARSERFTALQQIGSHLFIQRREMRYVGAFGFDGSLYLGAHAGVFAGAAAERGQTLASGVYFYRVETAEGIVKGRIAILK